MSLKIRAAWVRSSGRGPDIAAERREDEASLARLSMSVGAVDLVRAEDRESKTVRAYSVLPAYALAEWLAWHWWRLCWEPQRSAGAWGLQDWDRAHRMQSVGGGWLWPPVTLISDGQRMTVRAVPSRDHTGQPLSYLADEVCVIPLNSFEAAADDFVDRVLCQLDVHGLRESELETIWQELSAERADPELVRYRRTEALLGCDPDEATPEIIEAVLRDAETLGQGAMAEVAGMAWERVMTAGSLSDWAHRYGFGGRVGDRAQLKSPVQQSRAVTPAWRLGAGSAQALREQERLGGGPLSNAWLAALCGVDERAIDTSESPVGQGFPLAFDLAEDQSASRVVLRSRWETGRRFELARLLGDHLTDTEAERLHPATNTYTYRQKIQRAFAAELLAPTDSLATYLDSAASAEEAIEDAAGEFQVSPWVVTRLLVNGGHLGADFLNDAEPESTVG